MYVIDPFGKTSDDSNMLGNIGHLFLKCMQQVTKGHLYHRLGVLDYYVIHRQRAWSVLENVCKGQQLGN